METTTTATDDLHVIESFIAEALYELNTANSKAEAYLDSAQRLIINLRQNTEATP